MAIHELRPGKLLHNLTLLDDTLDLSNKERADTHCTLLACLPMYVALLCQRTLFADQGIVAVVGIVRITRRSTAAIAEGSEIKL